MHETNGVEFATPDSTTRDREGKILPHGIVVHPGVHYQT